MTHAMSERAVRALGRKRPIGLQPKASIAIKRDVHEFVVGTDAATFAGAFRAEMMEPANTFGLIRVKRPAHRLGAEFRVGERFQGCFSLEMAVLAAAPWMARVMATRPVRWLAGIIEDAMLSDYAEIEEMVLTPAPGEPYRLRYRYLEGTPIGGSSTFLVEEQDGGRARVRQIFEYQEVNGIALGTFQRFGLKYHDQVVHMQIARAAERAGAKLLSGTIPEAYARLSQGESLVAVEG